MARSAISASRGVSISSQTALRLSYADFNDDGMQGAKGKNLTLAANWYWNANARMQFNYIFGRIDDRFVDLGGGVIEVVSCPYEILGTRFMIDF